MTKMYNTPDYDEAYKEAEEYFDSLDEKDEIESEEIDDKIVSDDKSIHRARRKNARKAKKHQLKLAASAKNKRHSPHRWNPSWHKTKLSDISPKKFKERFDDSFTKSTIEEFQSSQS